MIYTLRLFRKRDGVEECRRETSQCVCSVEEKSQVKTRYTVL
jgi:hypothetical protein